MPDPIDPNKWFVKGVWGVNTAMATRTAGGESVATGTGEWDANCSVTPLIGGFARMTSIRTDRESAITQATSDRVMRQRTTIRLVSGLLCL
jgi:hypothetical protein